MVLQKRTIQVLKNKKNLGSRNEIRPTKGKVVVLKNEIKQNLKVNWKNNNNIFYNNQSFIISHPNTTILHS